MKENNGDNRIVTSRETGGGYRQAGGGQPGGARYNMNYTIKAGPVMGPLIGCPLMLLMTAFVLLLIPVTMILAMFGGRRSANALRMKAEEYRRMRTGRGGFRPSDPDVIDVEAEEIPPDGKMK